VKLLVCENHANILAILKLNKNEDENSYNGILNE